MTSEQADAILAILGQLSWLGTTDTKSMVLAFLFLVMFWLGFSQGAKTYRGL